MINQKLTTIEKTYKNKLKEVTKLQNDTKRMNK